MGKTRYYVMRQDGSGMWEEYSADVEATSSKSAIRLAATDKGEYVAIPLRSWNPVPVAVETKVQLKIG